MPSSSYVDFKATSFRFSSVPNTAQNSKMRMHHFIQLHWCNFSLMCEHYSYNLKQFSSYDCFITHRISYSQICLPQFRKIESSHSHSAERMVMGGRGKLQFLKNLFIFVKTGVLYPSGVCWGENPIIISEPKIPSFFFSHVRNRVAAISLSSQTIYCLAAKFCMLI